MVCVSLAVCVWKDVKCDQREGEERSDFESRSETVCGRVEESVILSVLYVGYRFIFYTQCLDDP